MHLGQHRPDSGNVNVNVNEKRSFDTVMVDPIDAK